MAISSQNSILNQWVPPFSISSPREGQVLVYDSYTKTFTNRALPHGGIDGCGTGASLDDLNDVLISKPETGDVLTYINGQWTNAVNFGGNNITGMNVGTGVGVFKDKVQTLLRFKSLLPGDNVTLVEDQCMNTITINVTPSAALGVDAFTTIKADTGGVVAVGEDYINIVGNGVTTSTSISADRTLMVDWSGRMEDLSNVSLGGDDTPLAGQVLQWDGFNWVPGDKLAIGSSYFIGLFDTPDTYIRQAGKVLAVKLDETGIEFVDMHSGAGAVTSVFGRNGNVVAQTNDYSAVMVTFVPSSSVPANNVQDAIDVMANRLGYVAVMADTAVQPNDNISVLNNDTGYITDIENETLNDLSDVNTSPVLGDLLMWDGVQWVNTNMLNGGVF